MARLDKFFSAVKWDLRFQVLEMRWQCVCSFSDVSQSSGQSLTDRVDVAKINGVGIARLHRRKYRRISRQYRMHD